MLSAKILQVSRKKKNELHKIECYKNTAKWKWVNGHRSSGEGKNEKYKNIKSIEEILGGVSLFFFSMEKVKKKNKRLFRG